MSKKKTQKNISLQDKSNLIKQNSINSKIIYHNFLYLFVIIILGIGIYSNSFDCSFHFDDTPNIIENKAIQTGATFNSIWNYSHNRFWPLLSLAINYRMGGLDVWGYHFFNLLIHLSNACIVYWIVISLFSTPVLKTNPLADKKKIFAFTVAILFVSHPLATQSVTYIVQRMASMAALFYFLTVAFYIKARITENYSKLIFLTGALISAFMAFTSKENAFTLPLSILLTEICFMQTKRISFSFRDYRIYLFFLIPIILVVFVLKYFTLNIFNPIPPSFGNTYTITWQNYLFTQFSVIVKYIQLLILPINQNLDYDFPISKSLIEFRTLISLLIIITLITFALTLYNKNRLLTFCILWFFITLAIESSFVPIADVIFEHRTYLPSLGFFILITFFIFKWGAKHRNSIVLSVILFLIFFYSGLTYARNRIWKDEMSLMTDIEKKSPQKARSKVNLGMEYYKREKWDEALNYFIAATKIDNNYFDAFNNMAVIFLNKSDRL
jgi:tetratricopeptide (TPR) repeat protein